MFSSPVLTWLRELAATVASFDRSATEPATAYACATLGQIGTITSTVALNSFVAFILFSSQALPPAAALQQSVLVFSGGLVQAALLLIAWPTERHRRDSNRNSIRRVPRIVFCSTAWRLTSRPPRGWRA